VRDRLRPLIRDMLRRDGRAALFVSHDRLNAWRLADRILVLEHGILSQCAAPQAMYASPATATAARCMGAEGRLRVQGAGGGHVVTAGGCRVPATCIGLAAGTAGVALAHPDGVCIGRGARPAGHPPRLRVRGRAVADAVAGRLPRQRTRGPAPDAPAGASSPFGRSSQAVRLPRGRRLIAA